MNGRAELRSLGAKPRFIAATNGASPGESLVRWGKAAEAVRAARASAAARWGQQAPSRGASNGDPPDKTELQRSHLRDDLRCQ
jgi:hypothetical protein